VIYVMRIEEWYENGWDNGHLFIADKAKSPMLSHEAFDFV
jgi:hypothetical protein